jgi:2-keto-4-pentenoate hydratase/2-oxohepta-3-ene-1,7-dioic acid hydratase in catechol pathway
MRLVTFDAGQGARLGALRDDLVVDLARLAESAGGEPLPADMLAFIDRGPEALARTRSLLEGVSPEALERAGGAYPLGQVHLLAPILRPRQNIVCLGLNYSEHAAESARARGRDPKLPEHPIFFTKAPATVNHPDGDIPFDPSVTEQLDWEVELGVILDRAGKDIPASQALDYVFGYTVINDISARDIQMRHVQWFKGKSLDGACPMGPCIVTSDEIPNPQTLSLRLTVNGVVKQEANTSIMIFPVAEIIAVLSLGMTLEPGEIIATGTPSGVGMGRTPPEYLRPGDLVEATIEGIGTLRNQVVRVVER